MTTDTSGSILAARMAGVMGVLAGAAFLLVLGAGLTGAGHGTAWYLEAALSPFWMIDNCYGALLALGWWAAIGVSVCLSDIRVFKYLFRLTTTVQYAGLVCLIFHAGLPGESTYAPGMWWALVYLGMQLVMWLVHMRLGGAMAFKFSPRRRVDKNTCAHCGYDLRASPSDKACPECGGVQ